MDEQKPLDGKPSEDYPPSPIDPLDPQDPEVLKKKKRRRIIIILSIVFGGLFVLAGIGLLIIYLIGQSITQICQNSCSNCTCDCGCDDACSNACSNSCDSACSSSSCSCGGDNITANADTINNGLDTQTYAKYVWETMKEWLFDLFN